MMCADANSARWCAEVCDINRVRCSINGVRAFSGVLQYLRHSLGKRSHLVAQPLQQGARRRLAAIAVRKENQTPKSATTSVFCRTSGISQYSCSILFAITDLVTQPLQQRARLRLAAATAAAANLHELRKRRRRRLQRPLRARAARAHSIGEARQRCSMLSLQAGQGVGAAACRSACQLQQLDE